MTSLDAPTPPAAPVEQVELRKLHALLQFNMRAMLARNLEDLCMDMAYLLARSSHPSTPDGEATDE